MKLKHYPLLTCLCLLAGIKAFGYDAKINGIYYNFFGNEAEVTYQLYQNYKYSSDYSGAVSIPSYVTYDGKSYTVTGISDWAFNECSNLTSVTIPNSVKRIGARAFWACNKLTSFTIPYGVTSVGDYIFCNCSGITYVSIPNSLVTLGEHAFTGCTGLTSVTIPNSVKSISYACFNNCSKLTNITIPESVTSIGSWAFSGCSSLASITIPNSVSDIGGWAFDGTAWYSNQSNGLVYAGKVAYKYKGTMSSGTQITLKDGTTGIANNAFSGCSGLSAVTIPNSVMIIGGSAFYECKGLTSISIPNSVKSIVGGAFQSCTGLTSIVIPNGVTDIGSTAFKDCSRLSSITIPGSVSVIGNNAFEGTAWYNNQPNGLVYAGKVAYKYKGTMPSGTSIIIKDGTLGISHSAFSSCTGMTSVTLPNTLTNIGTYGFSGCTGLNSIVIPDGVTNIDGAAFESCKGLTSAIIGNSVTTLGTSVFQYCSNLTSVTLGRSVKSIGNYAFNGCPLTSVTVGMETPIVINEHVILNRSRITLYVPLGCKAAYEASYYWQGFKEIKEEEPEIAGICYSLDTNNKTATVIALHDGRKYEGNIVIPSSITHKDNTYSVTSIGNSAFKDCASMTSITIPGSMTSFGEGAFYGCSGLTAVHITDLAAWCSISSLNNNSQPLYFAHHLYLNGQEITDLVIPEGVTSIGNTAFWNCSDLTHVSIPNSVTSIGDCAFCGCNNIVSLRIGNGVNTIGHDAFNGCAALTSITIPSSVTNINYQAFLNCTGLESATILCKEIGSWFRSSSIKELIIGNNVTKIGGNAFEYCNNLTSVIMGDSVTTIGEKAFYNCSNLTSVAMSKSVTSIGSSAFQSCNRLASITIPGSVTEIGSAAFRYCNAITYVKAEIDTPVAIEEYTFSNRRSATLYVPEGCKSAYAAADYWKEFKTIKEIVPEFAGLCYSLNKTDKEATVIASPYGNKYEGDIVIPSSVTFEGETYSVTGIGWNAFANCTELTSVTFPNSMTSITGFSGCTGLTSVTFPNSVTSISGFDGCTNLSSITIPNSVTSISGYTFEGTAWYNNQPDGLVYAGKVAYKYKGTMPQGTHISIKEGTLGIAGYAFSSCTGLTSVTIPNTVTNIGDIAFSSCTGLTSITIPASVTRFGGEVFSGCNFIYVIMENETPIVNSIEDWYSRICTRIPILYVPTGCKDAYIAAFSAYGYDNWNYYVWSIKDRLPDVVNGIYYNLDTANNVAEVTYPVNGEKYQGNVVIPSSVTYKGKTYSVTSIGAAAFYQCSNLTSVTIPAGVESIGTHAFYQCTGLLSVIAERETPVNIYIKGVIDDVFSGCWNATLYVPAGSKEAYTAMQGYNVGWNVFQKIVEGLPSVVNGLYYWFDKAGKVAQVTFSPYGDKYKGSINIPSSVSSGGETYSVTSIDSLAFRYCTELTSVVIPNSVTDIYYYSFQGCTALTSVSIPSSVTNIGDSAFEGCSSLPSITIPNSVTSIGSRAFYYCTSLTSANIPDGVTSIEWGTFYGCSGLSSIVIPNSVTSISNHAFYNCTNLSSIVIPNSVTSIDGFAFDGTAWFDGQPNGLVYAGKVAYKYKGTMPEGTQLVIREGTVGIASYAFNMCSGLASVIIPESVMNIGNDAFYYCNNLTYVKVEMETPPQIWWGTFSNRANATLHVPAGCKTLYAAANYWREFKEIIEDTPQIAGLHYRLDKSRMVAEVIASPYGDKYQGNIVIPDSVVFSGSTFTVTSIADSAFYRCTSLNSVTIPAGMMTINKNAFAGCYSFTFYASRGTDGLLAVWNYGATPYETGTSWQFLGRPYISVQSKTQTSITYSIGYANYDLEYETSGESMGNNSYRITGLRPEYSQNIYLTVRSANNSYSTSTTVTTSPVTPVLSCENITASSFTAKGSCKFTGYIPDIISRKLTVDGIETDEDEVTFRGLDPNTSHICKYKLVLEYPGYYRYSCEDSKEITTAELTLTTKQPKTISEGNVIVAAETNLDDEETNVGFEWRRIDWTDDFDSKSGGAYLFEGMMEGYIRSLNSNFLWKFRPFYTSNAGNTYYGEWKGMDPSDYSYFEPTVHTYADIDVTGNTVEVKGYVMRGTDNVTSQGFMYWENNTFYSLRRRVASIPDNVTVVKASGNVMTARFENLEYETSYSYVAFVTTSEGETFYGEVKSFSTNLDPVGIDEVKTQEAVTEIARYDVQGRRLDKPQKGMNIVQYSDGTTRKVMVK